MAGPAGEDERFDLIIGGGGFAGMALARAIAGALGEEVRIAIVDRPPPVAAAEDVRASAISAGSANLLGAIGVWPAVTGEAQPVSRIEIGGARVESPVRPVLLDYDNHTREGEPASYILMNRLLHAALSRAVRAEPGITLVSGELQREHGREGPLGEDIALIRSQAQRCREILTRLSNLGDDEEGLLRQLSLIDLVEEVATPHRDFGVAIRIDHKGEGSPPRMRRNPAVLYGLGNILENAVDFASGEVTVTAAWTADDVSVAIEDDGPGFSADVMMRLGEPYLTTRAERAASAEPDGGGGLGLGFFIAKTFLERSGGRVDFSNRRAPENGARVHVLWPRTVFEAGAQSPGLERTAPMG